MCAPSTKDCYPAFVTGTPYYGNAKVSYNGVNYVSKWWESGEITPDQVGDGGWVSEGACKAAPVQTTAPTTAATVAPTNPPSAKDCYPAFVTGTPYYGDSKVSYNGVNYVSKWWESGEITPDQVGDGGWVSEGACKASPVQTTAPATITVAPTNPPSSKDCYPAFVTGTPYYGDSKVSYNGINYVSKWWESGELTPDQVGDGGWVSEGACKASPVTTTAPAPTTAATAVPTTAAASENCYPAFVIGTPYYGNAKVSYKNVNYVSKWWESGEITPDQVGDGGWVAEGACVSV
ncbi:hypothetical protein HDU98_007845 [Podochytrium sp. JEL0797]|nr:hypothetical protein HDU98_007845 [Podochytrium sp. JEL0797]